MPELSVIICTYNPRPDIFERCLNCIAEAAAFLKPLEIIIVDNQSAEAISQKKYVQDFVQRSGNVKIIVESKQGLTPARLRGIKESRGELLVFIDDDNLVHAQFFKAGAAIADRYPEIGSWSGQVKLLFEQTPENWTRKYWGLLVYREFSGNYWSNLPHLPETMPCGAGLFVRRKVAAHYLLLHESGKRNVQLDRTGSSLFSAGDNDLAACACDVGMGVGIFDSIIVEHYIPKERITKQYLLRLAEGISQSAVVFRSFRGEAPPPDSLKRKMANRLRVLLKKGIDKEFQQAVFRGEQNGRLTAKNILASP